MKKNTNAQRLLILKGLFLFAFLLLMNCYTFSQDKIIEDTTKIIRLNKRNRKFYLPTKTINYEKNRLAVLSPDKTKIAILKYGKYGDSSTTLKVYNVDGDSNEFIVDAYDAVSIANDGRFAIYGSEPIHVANGTSFSLYSPEGKKIYSIDKVYSASRYVWEHDNKIVYLYAISECSLPIVNFTYRILIFDANSNVIGDRMLDELKDSFIHPIKHTNNYIVLGYKTKEKKKKSLFLNYNCETIKEEDGWDN